VIWREHLIVVECLCNIACCLIIWSTLVFVDFCIHSNIWSHIMLHIRVPLIIKILQPSFHFSSYLRHTFIYCIISITKCFRDISWLKIFWKTICGVNFDPWASGWRWSAVILLTLPHSNCKFSRLLALNLTFETSRWVWFSSILSMNAGNDSINLRWIGFKWFICKDNLVKVIMTTIRINFPSWTLREKPITITWVSNSRFNIWKVWLVKFSTHILQDWVYS